LQFILSNLDISGTIVIFFLAGMISVLTGTVFAGLEVLKGYEIIKIEIKES
jgi:hypothetical protein